MSDSTQSDEIFRKAAFLNELPQSSNFDQAAFLAKLEGKLKTKKQRKGLLWYMAAASVVLFFCTWTLIANDWFTEKLSSQPPKHLPQTNHTLAIALKHSPKKEPQNIIDKRPLFTEINKQVPVNQIIDSIQFKTKDIEFAELSIPQKPNEEIDLTTVAIQTNPIEAPKIEEVFSKATKAKQKVKFAIVHANELNGINEIKLAEKEEQRHRFIVVHFKLPQSSPEPNLLSLIHQK